MEHREFQVEVIGRQRSVYRVQAQDAESARRIAGDRWRSADRSDVEGFDWCELESARAVELQGSSVQDQDDQLLLRFIREREKLLLRLGGSMVAATANDAISAAQAASDLGWFLPDPSADPPVPDTFRAAQALDRMCERKEVICFERPRSRAGERGEIRLYCTPEYLERLSASLRSPTNAPS
jgi:hypothetical protein